jgi:DNA-binding MarR family transcriptional regulator
MERAIRGFRMKRSSSAPRVSGSMLDRESEILPDGRSLGLPDYLVWLGNQLTATAVGAYATLGVGFLEARILVALGRNPDLLAASLVQQLGVDRSAISRALQQLKGAGMVIVDEQRRLSLSQAGWLKRAQVAEVYDERLAGLVAGLTEPELEQLLGLLKRLHRNVPQLFVLNRDLTSPGGRRRRLRRVAP